MDRWRWFVCLLAVVPLAACSEDEPVQTAGPTTTVLMPATTSPATPTTAAPTTRVAPTTTVATATTVARQVVLEAGGLGVVSFGDGRDAVVSALTAALGPPDATGTGCPLAGSVVTTTSWKELSVQFADGRFDAYTVRAPSGTSPVLDLRTRAGIGLGSTVAELRAAYGDRLTIPGLPPAFDTTTFAVSFPGTDRVLRGILSATAEDGRVTGIFTQICD